jgi:phytoene/squalene synthetase
MSRSIRINGAPPLLAAASRMGVAPRCVNIARDVWVDARIAPARPVHFPAAWLTDAGTFRPVLLAATLARAHPDLAALAVIGAARARTLAHARGLYADARVAVERLLRT